MDLVQYINQIGNTFWSGGGDSDKFLHHGMYEQKLVQATPALVPGNFVVSMHKRNCELNEDIPYP